MGEQRNLDIVQQVYAAFRTRDLQAILALQAQDVEWSVAGPGDLIPWGAPRHGRNGVSDFLKVLGEWLAVEQFEIRDYFVSGDKVVALGDQRGRVRPRGTPYAFDFVHVWTLRDHAVTGFRVYFDTAYVAAVLGAKPSGGLASS